jgi:hypothetical protein
MNLWNAFQKVVSYPGLIYIGEVVSVESTFGDQRCTVQVLPGTALVSVTGTGRALEIGQRWIIQNGKIVEEGPTGAIMTAEI